MKKKNFCYEFASFEAHFYVCPKIYAILDIFSGVAAKLLDLAALGKIVFLRFGREGANENKKLKFMPKIAECRIPNI